MVSVTFDDETCFEKVRAHAESHLSAKRYEHSIRVAETAALMCRLYGASEAAGRIAGIAHDICKEIPGDEAVALASQDGKPISEIEAEKPSLLHGRAAAVKIKDEFGILDADVASAVANHTFGASGLCDLGKILFVADKIEPGRPQSTEEYRNALLSKPLPACALAVLEENIAYLEKRGKTVARSSLEWAEELRHGNAE